MIHSTGHHHTGLSRAHWRKSSYSGDQGNCIEVFDGLPGRVPVRDSKVPTGPVLVFGWRAWAAFTAQAKRSG
ncbi:DUF397 domain-containing protein [Streptomyces sp. NRRL F-5135]|uniref:DUF397 domain-containing protein n=1 Tax=Streptomyces sp. NRRL F-5135 TaxID=1463858 RepID=UPI000A45FCC1|nr:DUF397 domain-containing protein [Streptomyces sp. NRRL F-5135]